MVSEQTWVDAGYTLAFLLLYGLVAGVLATTPPASDFHPYLRTAVALALSLGVVAAIDVVPRLIRGDRPLVEKNSRLYSIRGVVLLILVILVIASVADLFRATTTLSESVLTSTAIVIGAIVVFGPLVGYYWYQSVARSR